MLRLAGISPVRCSARMAPPTSPKSLGLLRERIHLPIVNAARVEEAYRVVDRRSR